MLKNISEKLCPVCKSEIKEESKYDQHTNKLWNERRVFKCGCIINFSPNFNAYHNNTDCPKSKEVVNLEKIKYDLIGDIFKIINKSKLNDNAETLVTLNGALTSALSYGTP